MTRKHRKLNTAVRIAARADSAPDDLVVLNYNLSADCTRARAKHSTQHGTPRRFVEARDASGKCMRSMRGMHTDPRKLPRTLHPVTPPA